MEDGRPVHDDLFDNAVAAIEATAQGKGDLADARAAYLEVSDFRPKGMEAPVEQGPEKDYGDAAASLKMALDSLESDQSQLALSYLRVAKIKLEKAREA